MRTEYFYINWQSRPVCSSWRIAGTVQ